MATQIFAWFEGASISIPPETNDPTYGPKGAFEVQSFSLGVDNPVNVPGGTRAGGGKPPLSEVTLLKKMGNASPALFQAAAAGTLFPTMVVVVRLANNAVMAYTFRTVRITKLSTVGNQGEIPLEELTLVYGAVQARLSPPTDS